MSTTSAQGSGTEDTKVRSLVFHLVAKWSTWGEPQRKNRCFVICWLSNHCGESLVWVGEQVGYYIYIPWNVYSPLGDLQIDDQLK